MKGRGSSAPIEPLRIVDLGAVPYDEALRIQRKTQEAVIAQRTENATTTVGTAYFVQHDPPVVSITRRKGAEAHLVASAEQLAAAGVDVVRTDRGGDITYHGPGQLVVYPIVDLNRLKLNLHAYMRWLEEVVICACGRFGIKAHRDGCATGVWVGGEETAGKDALGGGCDTEKTGAKICAMGIRVRRWVTSHGLAINVAPEMAHFGLIVPCGLAGRAVTSMAQELGGAQPSMDEVKAVMEQELLAAVRKRLAEHGV